MNISTDSSELVEPDQAAKALLSDEQIRAFWAEFAEQEASLFKLPARDFVEEANALLQKYAPALAIEVLGDDQGKPRELVLSAHGARDQFVNLMAVVQAAPPLQWHTRVTAFRMRAEGSEFSIGMDGFQLSTTEVEAGLYADAGLVGMELRFLRDVPMDMVEHVRHMAFIMLDHVLGEYDFAVRVGPVDFVDSYSEAVECSVALSELPARFDHYWRETLGHTGDLPRDATQHAWTMLSLQTEETDRPLIVSFSESANAVATRADLTHRLDVSVDVPDDASLERARDLQEALCSLLEVDSQGVLVLTIVFLEQGRRLCRFYLDAPERWLTRVHEVCARHGFPETDIGHAFDPSWGGYFEYQALNSTEPTH